MAECPQCARPLLTTGVEHCMYCGAELPEALKPSEQQKDARRQRLRESADQDAEKLKKRRQREIERNDSEPSGFSFWNNCGSDGGGDCGGD